VQLKTLAHFAKNSHPSVNSSKLAIKSCFLSQTLGSIKQITQIHHKQKPSSLYNQGIKKLLSNQSVGHSDYWRVDALLTQI
jgi:hypothetical protein